MYDWSQFDAGQWILAVLLVLIAGVFVWVYLMDIVKKDKNDDNLPRQ